ncbi:MAG: hypothetical protein IRZ02_04645 [Acidothermus sp.]|nr:hypothetical protein [Acidothermus sp.]MCL6538725.1 hypothetical protein [Acidothermus sp.]
MRPTPTCPRCGATVRPPNAWSSAWSCEAHGGVAPLWTPTRPGPESLEAVRRAAAHGRLPVWLPWPLPEGWLCCGYAFAGDERSGAVVTVVGLCGPSPLGGGAEWLLLAENPGVGLGARLAGLVGPDPGAGFDAGPPHVKLDAAGHPTALWSLDTGPEAAVFVGEARAAWLWALIWPAPAGVVLLEGFALIDLVERTDGLDIPYGALSPRLAALGSTTV